MQVLKTTLIGMVLVLALLALPAYPADEATPGTPPATDGEPVEVVGTNGEMKVKLNFQDAPLQTVLEYLSEKAGLTIVASDTVADGRMTVISRQPISLDDAVTLINSVLKEKGLTTVLIGKTLKVVTQRGARTEQIPVRTVRDPNAITPSDDMATVIIPVAHVTASALRDNLESLVPEYADIQANEDGNALIVTDTMANIRRLLQIVVALDTHMATVAEIRVFRLVNANATSVATLVNSIFQQQAQSGARGRTGRGTFAAGAMEMMMQMRGGGRGRQGNNDQGSGQSAGGSINVQVVAAADEQTNSVVVRGPADAMGLVAQVIDAMDDKTAKIATVRVFQLRYADAMNTADVINQLFNQSQSTSSRGGRTGRGAFGAGTDMGPMMFRGPGGGPGQQEQAEGATMVQVSAAADSRTNTVVVTGPDAVLDVVAGVITKLDTPISNVADVKVFHLNYASATDTAQLINEVFGQQSSTSSRSSRNGQQNQQVSFRGGRGGMMMGAQQSGSTSGGGSISDVAVNASADTRTNTVVVSGPPATLEAIAEIVKELDENPEQERRIFVYALKNANATNLMTILNNMFAEMQALNQQGTGTRGTQQFQGGQARGAATATTGGTSSSSSSGGEDLSEETYFEADPNTNSLLCMTSTKNYEKIKPIIEQLDKAVGQVLIKVLFAEITHSNSVDLGTEFSMLNLRNDISRTGTFTGASRGTMDIVPGSGAPPFGDVLGDSTRTSTAFGTPSDGGLSLRLMQGDLDLTLTALEKVGRLNVLSRPYVMTKNNQPATITVAQQVPIPSGTTTVAGQTQTTVEYRDDIGIVLTVTPSINPEGLVNMTINPSITTRTAEKVQISETLFAETFATRSATTQVAVKDGQTIVIGGLIEDQLTDTIKKVPLLGDIPIAGILFRRTIQEKSKTELLIFLTPIVAEEPEELVDISNAERERSNLNTDTEAGDIFRRHMEAMEGQPAKSAKPRTPEEPNEPGK
jgi:type II secretion system protein D